MDDRGTLLAAAQNSDGGWPYRRGSSWTEPTLYALLALLPERATPMFERGLLWLRRRQRPDGGWAPNPGVAQSTWVTALALLLPPELLGTGYEAALGWVMRQSGSETTWVHRARQFLLGNATRRNRGWPWYPGAAGWVTPSALSILALDKVSARFPSPEVRERAAEGRRFLWEVRCADGGWNHGSSRALGYDSPSYPETTGTALLALRGASDSRLPQALERARRHYSECRSAEAAAWLRLGLAAHGELVPERALPAHEVTGAALAAAAASAAAGRNAFLV